MKPRPLQRLTIWSMVFSVFFMEKLLSMGLRIKKYPKPSYFGSGRTRLSCCARVWSLGRFPYDSGWSTGRLAALPSPSLRSKLPRSPLLRTSFCPWFHLNFLPPGGRTLDPGNGGRPAGHFLPTAHGRLWARSRGPCTGRPLSCAGYTGSLLPLLAIYRHSTTLLANCQGHCSD